MSPTDDKAVAKAATSRAEREVLRFVDDPLLKKMLDEERVETNVLDSALFTRLLAYVKPHKGLAAWSILLAMVEALTMTVPAYLIGVAVDRLSNTPREGNALVAWINGLGDAFVAALEPADAVEGLKLLIVFFGLTILAVWLLRWGVAAGTTYAMQKLGQQVVHDLRVHVFRHITAMDARYFHKNPVGRLVNRTTFDIQALSELFSDAFAQGIRDLLFIAVLLVVMLSMDPVLALVIVGAFPLLVIVAWVYRVWARPALRTNSAVQSRMNAWLAENLAGMRENHLYRTEPRRRTEFESLTAAHQVSITRVIRAWAFLRPAMMLVSGITTCVVLGAGYWRVSIGVATVGVILTFLQYTGRLWVPVRNLTQKFNLIQTALTAGERVFDVLDTRPRIVDDLRADPSLKPMDGAIAFDDVTFTYPDKDEPALRGVSFEVGKGEMLALVGDTGAGKSTIARLLSRFYDVQGGRVLLDGRDVRDYTLGNLRGGIAMVPQDVVIFAGTIRENITLGRDIADERIWTCARAVCADVFIERFADGLDHVLEEAGRTLSTGERQLLSFARALVLNPPVLMLDEATANVDTQTEILIQRALDNLTAGRTSVVIAHRLSTIVSADLILVLRHGQIVEAGTHEELLALGGEYARLYELHLDKVAA